MNEIREEEKKQQANGVPQGANSNQFKPLDDTREYIPEIGQETYDNPTAGISPFTKRIKKGAWILLGVAIAGIIAYGTMSTSKSVDTSDDAAAALESHMSTSLAAGAKLMSSDDNYVGGDLTITHNSNADETTLYVWDYAAEDGDYVEVIVNGTSLGEPFMIKNKPVTFTVPTVGEVQVVGTRDGGGGITYAVYYDMNHTTYFNGVDQGGNNTYTLVRE